MSQPPHPQRSRAGGPAQADQVGPNPIVRTAGLARNSPQGPAAGLARNSPRGPSEGRISSQERARTAPGPNSGILSGIYPDQPRQDDQFSHIQEYWKKNPTPRMQSLDQNVLLNAQQILRSTRRVDQPKRTCGQGTRFKLELALLYLQPFRSGDQQAADVMKTLFHVPVEQTMFEVPEFSGPLRLDSLPHWVMAKRKVPDAERRKVRYDLNSSWFEPTRYPSWPENIRACYAVLNTHYHILDPQDHLLKVGNPMPEIRIAVGAPFVNDNARPLTISEFQNIAIAIIHFEDQFQLNTQRLFRRRIWQDNPKLEKKSESKTIAIIQRTKTAKQLCDLLNPIQGEPWLWEFSKPDCVVYATADTFHNASECTEKVAAIVEFMAACLLITSPAEVMAYQNNETGYTQFITAMEARYREPAMDGSRRCQPTFERLSNATQQPAPAPARRGFLSRALPTRGQRG